MDDVAAVLATAGRSVEAAGADFLVLCTTTFHMVADQVQEAVGIPLLHLANIIAEACRPKGSTPSGSSAPRSRSRARSSPTGCGGTASRCTCPTPATTTR